MVQNVKYGSSFNAANAFVDDIYIEVIPPPGYFSGTPTSIAACPGTAPWGQLNTPTLLSTPQQMTQVYGGITAAAINDIHDLCTDVTQTLNQAATNGLYVYGIRVSDGTDTRAAVNLYDGAATSITFSGTTTPGNVINITVVNPNLAGGSITVQYTVQSGDSTATLLAASVNTAFNGTPALSGAGFASTNTSSPTLNITWTASGQVNISATANGTTTATITGTATAGDILKLVISDAGLVSSGGQVAVDYVVQSGDTVTLMATGLKNLINNTPALAAIGVTATSSVGVLSIKSTSTNKTTYAEYVTGAVTETITLAGGASEAIALGGAILGITLQGKWTGSAGDALGVVLAAGSLPNTITVTVVPFPGGGNSEIYQNLPGGNTTFWPALQQAINGGLNSARGPSQYLIASGAQSTTNTPQLGTFQLAGGTDGRNVNTAQLVGNAQNNTGIYTLANVVFTPSIFWVCGLTDTTVYSQIQAFADNNNMMAFLTFPYNTSVASAATTKANLGIADYQVSFILGWVYWFDQINDIVRLIPSLSTAGGTIATLSPWQSPLNVTVQAIQGTERNNPYTGNVPLSNAELSQLTQSGITMLTNPIPAGNVFGFRNGYNSVGNKAINSTIEYSRMTNFLANSQQQILGQFLGKLQGFSASDALRAAVRAALNSFYQPMLTQNQIAGYSVICDLSNNSQQSIAQRQLNIQQYVTYMASVADIFVQLEGGTTVQVTVNQLGASLAA